MAIVPERQLSLAIGKEGQNARLAAKLTGWRVDIRSDVEDKARPKPEPKAPVVPLSEQLGIAAFMEAVGAMSLEALGLPSRLRNLLVEAEDRHDRKARGQGRVGAARGQEPRSKVA